MPRNALQRNSIHLDEYALRVLTEDEISTLSSFDCGNDDLNDFFRNESLPHREQLMAETYVFEEEDEVVALISFSNDAVELSKSVRRRLLPHEMRSYTSIPAVKIARFGVLRDHQGRGIGSLVINFCKKLFITSNRTGCRWITVDAYNSDDVLRFYQDQRFDFLSNKDAEKPTRIMWCDLKKVDIRD
ncbi:MAG: GNAT family N-acetyltransferase [Candidatus Latescibacteria bacterium]|nr:GNAT family N-acetyltransferase [Candidatus Latescibacterota bacterium]